MDAAVQALFSGDTRNAISGAFRRMDIAEQEIKRALVQHPEHRTRINDAFKLMCPSPGLRDKSDDLYRHHVRELIARVVMKHDTRQATRAELLAYYSELSLKAPLNRAGQAVFEFLFVELHGIAKVRDLGLDEYVSRAMYSGQVQEDIEQWQNKLTDPNRIM